MMLRSMFVPLSFALFSILVCDSIAHAQFAGSRGGAHQESGQQNVLIAPTLDLDVVQGFITVDGTAEFRVKPTSIRIVIAVTAEAETPEACQVEVNAKISKLKQGWVAIKIDPEKIVDDFIAVLPRYEFELSQKDGRNLATEKRSGYLMQSNLHVEVENDSQAMAAIRVAFANDVADIISFDYWNNDLDQLKKQARAAAIANAKEKSATLLEVFEKRPPLINVSESTQVVFPDSLYESIPNSSDDNFYATGANWRDTEVIRKFRPKNTYYRGLFSNSDVQPSELPMQSEISVVSTVKLYYESPVAKDYANRPRK